MSKSQSAFIMLDGFKWPSFGCPVENFHQIRKLDLREGDVVLNTYPKCGTNWTAYILWEILNQGLPPPQPKELLEQIPFVDMHGVSTFENNKESERLLTSHTPLPYFPFNSSVKYVVTIRNPFDSCVSAYHFMAQTYASLGMPVTFDQFFENFVSGECPFGDFFDHLLPWYEKRNDPNVLLLVYEEMVQDRTKCILEVARFLGEEHLQKMEGQTLEKVLEHTSFGYMKTQLHYEKVTMRKEEEGQELVFIRKGIVGDWKSCFGENQKLRMKQKMEEKLKGTELLDFWMKTIIL